MTIIIESDGRLIADTCVEVNVRAYRLSAGKIYYHGIDRTSVGLAGYGPTYFLKKCLDDELASFDELVLQLEIWANLDESNQAIVVHHGKRFATYGTLNCRRLFEIELGEPVAIGCYRNEWAAFSDAHGWNVKSALRFCSLIDVIHGLDQIPHLLPEDNRD